MPTNDYPSLTSVTLTSSCELFMSSPGAGSPASPWSNDVFTTLTPMSSTFTGAAVVVSISAVPSPPFEPSYMLSGAGFSCFAVLPLALHVLTAGIFASHRSSSVPYALGVSLMSVWSGTFIQGLLV